MTAKHDWPRTAPGARRWRRRHARGSARAAASSASERSGRDRPAAETSHALLANADQLLDEAAAVRARSSELERRLGVVRAALRTLGSRSR